MYYRPPWKHFSVISKSTGKRTNWQVVRANSTSGGKKQLTVGTGATSTALLIIVLQKSTTPICLWVITVFKYLDKAIATLKNGERYLPHALL
jgi:hypothetical protein